MSETTAPLDRPGIPDNTQFTVSPTWAGGKAMWVVLRAMKGPDGRWTGAILAARETADAAEAVLLETILTHIRQPARYYDGEGRRIEVAAPAAAG